MLRLYRKSRFQTKSDILWTMGCNVERYNCNRYCTNSIVMSIVAVCKYCTTHLTQNQFTDILQINKVPAIYTIAVSCINMNYVEFHIVV